MAHFPARFPSGGHSRRASLAGHRRSCFPFFKRVEMTAASAHVLYRRWLIVATWSTLDGGRGARSTVTTESHVGSMCVIVWLPYPWHGHGPIHGHTVSQPHGRDNGGPASRPTRSVCFRLRETQHSVGARCNYRKRTVQTTRRLYHCEQEWPPFGNGTEVGIDNMNTDDFSRHNATIFIRTYRVLVTNQRCHIRRPTTLTAFHRSNFLSGHERTA